MHDQPVAALVRGLADGEFSAEELARHYIERIARLDPVLNALVTPADEAEVLEDARRADAARAAGTAHALAGIPLLHKDIFCTRSLRTTCGSRMLEDFVSPYNATVVQRCQAAGMVTLGKTNMDEFAMGSSNETSYFGPVANPWDTGRVPGGSSGGSASAVAARLAPLATGTDTGGSIRQPAALCGVTGLKPTYGLVSRWGMIAFASSLDQAGPLAPGAEDCALLLGVMAGFDEKDSTSVERAPEDYFAALNQPLDGLRIGLPREYLADGLDASVRGAVMEAVRFYEQHGASVREVSLPHSDLAVPAYYVIAPAECSSNLSRFDGVRFGHRCADPENLEDLYKRTRAEGFGPEVKRRIMIGTYALSAGYYDAYYLQAQKARRLIQQDFVQAFAEVDVLLAPTTPETAFRRGEKTSDPVKMYLSDINTIAANLAGLPALSMPGGFADGLPVGVQLIGNYFDEGRLLAAAHAWQQETDFHARIPEAFR